MSEEELLIEAADNPDISEATEPNRNTEVSTTTPCSCNNSTQKICSLAYMAVCLLVGVVFLVAGKVPTDSHAITITRYPVYRFLTVVLFISIITMSILILQKYVRRWFPKTWWEKHEQPRKQLIPRRLLVGVMFFGLGSSFMTMVEFLEYLAQYDCTTQDVTMMIYYFIRTVFTYVQLYFFYKLTSGSEKIIILSHFQVMHLIAVNLVTWIVTFVHDSAEELSHSGEGKENSTIALHSFMARHWGVKNVSEECKKTAKDLESTAKTMEPYFYTFTMEYCLISAGLLLNVWLTLGRTDSTTAEGGEHNAESESTAIFTDSEWVFLESNESRLHEVGTLWRFGFILGLVYVPMFSAIIFNIMFADDNTDGEDKLIYVGFQFFFFLSILGASVYGSVQLEKQEEGTIHSEVDFYLLGFAMVGIFFLDLFIIVASSCEYHKSPNLAILLVFTNLAELMCSIAFTHFVYKALQRKLPSSKTEEVLRSAARIREIVSFLFMLNICFWAMYTFEVKKSERVLALTEEFYTKNIWFYISHFVYPLAVFFHFHGAVCMVEVLDIYSKVPVKDIASLAYVQAATLMSQPQQA